MAETARHRSGFDLWRSTVDGELANLDPAPVVTVEHYDGAGVVRALRPIHIDLRIRPHPAAVVITVVGEATEPGAEVP